MAAIFEQTEINGLRLRNRLVRSATWEGMCEPDGRPTQGLARFYGELAKGGVGLIISGYTFVRPEGKQLPGKMGIHTDDFEPQFKALSQAVHEAGGKIAIQLVHAGGQTDSRTIGRKPLAPSAIETPQFSEVPEELSVREIGEIVTAFGQSAARAKAWGFDAVQMHGAHGYLINQFLSPLTNRRNDEFGGSFENRSRFLLQVHGAVRKAVGPDFPVMIKLNSEDNVEGGLTLEDAVLAAKALDAAGIDAIEVSGGTPASGENSPVRVKINVPEKEAYHLDAALKIKQAVSCPVMAVGGFRSFEVAKRAVRDLGLDYVSMARPLIREPGLPNRWLSGDTSPARCISCNSCFGAGLKEGGIYCVTGKKEREKAARA